MAGNPLLAPVLRGGKNPRAQNGIVAAIDISFFIDLEDYKNLVDNLVDELKALPKADGFDDILMPGEPENLTLAQRAVDGIPFRRARRKNSAKPRGGSASRCPRGYDEEYDMSKW